ncbi:hypothetical protein ACNKF0_09305 [Nocardioides sp. T5]|uniref:hypothetical protein n=1 Tax=Nocardioides sp. T5 TaxID=3400182 RepID=UPI003A83D9EE
MNFLAVGQQNALIQIAQANGLQLEAPQRVDTEVLGKTRDPLFARTAVLGTWATLKSTGRLRILDDTLTGQQFIDAVTRISGMPAADRVRSKASLGEILVLAHASVYAQNGTDVFVLIDEGDGRKRTEKEQLWLQANKAPGTLTLWGSRQVLLEAEKHQGWIKNGLTADQVYNQMAAFDTGITKRLKARKARTGR